MPEELKPWTLAQIYADLVSLADIAKHCNVTVNRVRGWVENRATNGCPWPVKRVSHVDIYSLQEWIDWHKRFDEKYKTHKKIQQAKTSPHTEAFWAFVPGSRKND